jgi:hypothetical protein
LRRTNMIRLEEPHEFSSTQGKYAAPAAYSACAAAGPDRGAGYER